MSFMKIKMLNRILYNLCIILLLLWSIEIILRRTLWEQVPTQIPFFYVCGILLINFYIILNYLFKNFLKKK
jgi:TRAP-type C4-dicarboxylate transport system permease small subunit